MLQVFTCFIYHYGTIIFKVHGHFTLQLQSSNICTYLFVFITSVDYFLCTESIPGSVLVLLASTAVTYTNNKCHLWD